MKRPISNYDTQNNQQINRKYVKAKRKSDKSSASLLEKQILSLKRMVRSTEPPTKTCYWVYTSNPTNEWTGMGILYPTLGGALNQRLGQEITLKSIQINYKLSVASSDGFDTMRFVLVQFMDNNTSGNYPFTNLAGAVKQVFLADNTQDYPYISPFNTQTKKSYRILHDQTWCLDNSGSAQATGTIMVYPRNLAYTKLHYQDNEDASGLLPGFAEGMIVGFWCSDSSASPNPGVEAYVKTNYTDS